MQSSKLTDLMNGNKCAELGNYGLKEQQINVFATLSAGYATSGTTSFPRCCFEPSPEVLLEILIAPQVTQVPEMVLCHDPSPTLGLLSHPRALPNLTPSVSIGKSHRAAGEVTWGGGCLGCQSHLT